MKIVKVTITFFCEEQYAAGVIDSLDWVLHEELTARLVFPEANTRLALRGELSQSELEYFDGGGLKPGQRGIRRGLL